MLRYGFALLYNAFILFTIIITCSEHIGPIIASYSYCFDITDKRCHIYLLLLLGKIAFKSEYNMILVYFSR
jgi:hypothetical protein